MYLTIPKGIDFNTEHGFLSLLPSEEKLDMWQLVQREKMLRQYRNREPYAWTGGHDGCTEDHYYRAYNILKDHGRDGVFCCGLSLENLFMSHKEWMGQDFESDIDLTLKQMKEIKAYFFVYRDAARTYVEGSGRGIEYMGRMLKRRWDEAKQKSPSDYGESFAEDAGLDFKYHTDPYKAKFGAYVQIQNEPDLLKDPMGHAGVFVGLEQRTSSSGQQYDAIRIFQARGQADYGMESGVNFGWFKIGKTSKNSRYTRKFHFGEISEGG